MRKNKLRIAELKVQSFTTSLQANSSRTVKGGFEIPFTIYEIQCLSGDTCVDHCGGSNLENNTNCGGNCIPSVEWIIC